MDPTSKYNSNFHQDHEQFISHSFASKEEFSKKYRRVYHGKPEAKDLYRAVLAELKRAIVEGNVANFKRFYELIEYISDIESRITLKTYYNDVENPIDTVNFVIISCKHNRLEILKYLFSNLEIFKSLSSVAGKDVVPNDKDETSHDAFYYAVRSGNTDLLNVLINEWPGNYFASRSAELDDILSKSYEELKLKNVLLADKMEMFVENELINLRFFSNTPGHVQSPTDNLANIINRIDLLLKTIDLLKSECSNNQNEIDAKFLFVGGFIAKNIHVLKRQLKLTYDKLPWEELEFCLVAFLSSHRKLQEINLFYRAVLNKTKILSYLAIFAKKLADLKPFIENLDVGKLATLPKSQRELVVAEIIRNDPEFLELYNDHQQIRDAHSLQRINDYLILASSVNVEEKEGQLVIIRALQVIGEYLKNTLESPKMSSSTSEVLLSSLPKNTRKVVIDLRNSLSHAYSLSKRTEIEDNSNPFFFNGVQQDTKRIANVISDILYGNKTKMIIILLQKIADTENLREIESISDVFVSVELANVTKNSFEMFNFESIEKHIQKVRAAILEKTDSEEWLFKKIDSLISSAKANSSDIITRYKEELSNLQALIKISQDNDFDYDAVFGMKHFVKDTLQKFVPKIEPDCLKQIVYFLIKITNSAGSRIENDGILETINRLKYEICFIAEFESNDIHWIEKLKRKLFDKSSSISPNLVKSTATRTKDRYDKYLPQKMSELETILKSGQVIDSKMNKKLQAVVEMLVLDIMSILGTTKNHLENNLLFLDETTPLLTGKCLRNHLAHGNTLVDVLLSDPSTAVISNAKKLISENIVKSKKKVGKLIPDDPTKLRCTFDQNFTALTNQETMFATLIKGDLEELKICLNNGADINAKNSICSMSALHLAAQGPSIEMVKFVVDHNVPVSVKNTNGQTPLHFAAAYGRTNTVKFFLSFASVSIDDRDNSSRTPLHMAAKNGHQDTVEFLLKNKANTEIQDRNGYSPVHYAARNNHINVAKILLNKEPHVDANETKGGATTLRIAAEYGRLELVNFLLSQGANVNAKHDAGTIPLHVAALRGHPEVTKALILKGAYVNAKVLNGCASLHFAVEERHKEVVEILLKHGADVNVACTVYKNTPLHYVTKDGFEELVEILLRNKAKINFATVEGITPLHFAVKSGNLKIVASLLKHGAKTCLKNIRDYTALHYAAEYGHQEIAELLIKNGAQVNAKAKAIKDQTPLHFAALKGHHHVAELLIKHGAKTDVRDSGGYDPLLIAVTSGCKNVIDILLKNNAHLDSKTVQGRTALHESALGGYYDIVDFLIRHKADVNAKDETGRTPLHAAVFGGNKDIVDLLVKGKANVRNCDDLLLTAVREGNKEIVEILVSNGANVNLLSGDLSPLMLAVKKNHKEIVEILIKNGANVNGKRGEPITLAIIGGHLDIFEILLKNNARIDAMVDVHNYSVNLLHVAAKQGHVEMVSALIGRGANVNAATITSETPLEWAVIQGHLEVVKILLANGARIGYGSCTALHPAAAFGHLNIVDFILRKGVNIHAKDHEDRTAVELAVGRGHLLVVERLLQEKCININATGSMDCSLLLIASQQDNLNMVKYLVEKGANLHKTNTAGSKAIHFAARDGFKDIVEFFLNKGMDIHERGNANQTPLHYAAMSGQLDVVKFLIDRGADVNSKDVAGLTPTHFASAFGFVDVVQILLKNGAVYNVVDNYSRTPSDLYKVKSMQDLNLGQIYNVADRKKGVINIFLQIVNLFDAVKRCCPAEVKKSIKAGAFVNAKNSDTQATPLHYAAWKGSQEIIDILIENKAELNSSCSKGYTALHYAAKFERLECVKVLMSHGAIYNPPSVSGKTPLDLTKNKSIIALFKITDDSFRKIRNNNAGVINDLNKVDINDLKAIMNARNRDKKTLIAFAMQNDFSSIEKLKLVSQEDMSSEISAAVSLLHYGDYQKGLNILEKLFAKRKRILGPNNLATLEIQVIITEGLFKQGNYQKSLDMRQEIARKQEEMLGTDSAATLSSREMIAFMFHILGKNDESLKMYQQVIKKQKEILGSNHQNIINSQFHMALVLNDLGKYEEALNINEKVFELRKSTHGESHPLTVAAQNNVALVLSNQGKREEALQIYKDVFEKKIINLGINHADTLRTMSNIAAILMHQNKHQEALKMLEEILEIQKKALPLNHPETLTTQRHIAEILFSQHKFISAFKAYKRCYDQIVAIYGPSHSSVLDMNAKMQLITEVQLECRGIPISQVLQHLQNDISVAASNGEVQKVNHLLKKGADVNDKDFEGRTPLHFAVNSGHLGMVRVLLKNGADVTAASNKGNTPLHTAVSQDYKEIVQVLLQHIGQDKIHDFINAKTTANGMTSLHVAAKNGYLEMVKILLKNGAIYDSTNKEGKMPIDLANNREVVEFLKLIDEVFECTKRGSIEVIDKLKALKSDEFIVVSNSRNCQSHGLMQVAVVNKHKNIASALLTMLKKPN